MALNPRKTALTLGTVFALYILAWSLFIMFGGQAGLDWLMSIHFIQGMQAAPVTIGRLIASLIYHFIIGSILGWVFATVWNKLKA
jgi:hypothetical protein